MGGKALSKDLRDSCGQAQVRRWIQKNSKALSVPRSTVISIIKKWKVFGTTQSLPGSEHHSRLDKKSRRKLVREATKRPLTTLRHLTWQRVVIVYMWQQYHKFSTNVACMGGLHEKSHSSRKATCSNDWALPKRSLKFLRQCGKILRSASNWTELEQFCKEEWANIA